MGISKGNFYTYFKSKEEVFHESIEIKKRENKEMLDSIDISKEPAEILKEYFFSKMEKFLNHSQKISLHILDEMMKNEEIYKLKKEMEKMEIDFLKQNVLNKYKCEDVDFKGKFIYRCFEAFLLSEGLNKRMEGKESCLKIEKDDIEKIIKFIDKGIR